MSTARRHVKQPKIAPTTRSDVNVSFYNKIDAALKDLRTCARQIGPIMSSMEDELRVLERLFYKGKNQHRLAIFWRKVEEMRRFGKRVIEMQLVGLMDDLRYAFYEDSNSERNPSALKKAWTQVPDLNFMTYMLNRVEGANLLVAESRKRFAGVNRSLLLMMQTGAFLQYIVTLVAVVSRLDTLSRELQEPLCSWMNTVHALISVVKREAEESHIRADIEKTATAQPPDIAEDSLHEDLGEDLGSTISRNVGIYETVLSVKTSDTGQASAKQHSEDEVGIDISAAAIFESLGQHSGPIQALEDKQAMSVKQGLRGGAANTLVKRPAEDVRAPGPKVKKKKKKDAIDDIFGGL